MRAGEWSDALALADADAPKAALATAAAEAESDAGRALRLAKQAWKADPSLSPAALAYATRLRAAGRESRALVVIRHSWAIAPHPDLADFALAPVSDNLQRTQAAQRLTEANPDHAESRLLLARTALEAGLTGEARRHAEAAAAAGLNQRRLWLLLAEIEEAEGGDTEAGRLAQRDALRRAAGADPDPTWQCDACHTAHASWHPNCPDCFTVGSLRWGAPSRRTRRARCRMRRRPSSSGRPNSSLRVFQSGPRCVCSDAASLRRRCCRLPNSQHTAAMTTRHNRRTGMARTVQYSPAEAVQFASRAAARRKTYRESLPFRREDAMFASDCSTARPCCEQPAAIDHQLTFARQDIDPTASGQPHLEPRRDVLQQYRQAAKVHMRFADDHALIVVTKDEGARAISVGRTGQVPQ